MIVEELTSLLSPVVIDLGYELWGCEYLSQGKYSLLRIYIDKADGIGIEDCETVSRQVSAILDVEDVITGNYSLEVSSPGVPRGLFYAWQYPRYIGSGVQLKLLKPVENSRKVSGIIVSCDENSVVLEIGTAHREIQFSNIVKANLIVL